jgi:peptidoglycan/xylan/chitin deacetylase (PgdA/CDA1 family)
VKLFDPGKPLSPAEIRNLFFSARRCVIWALYYAGLLHLSLRLPRRSHRGLLILMYHSVGKPNLLGRALRVSAENFSAQLDYLSRRFQVVSLESAVERLRRGEALPENAVALTFDDGFQDTYEIAFPILRERRLPATVFVAESVLHRRSLWNYKLLLWIGNSRAARLEFTAGEFGGPAPAIFDLTTARRRRRAARAILSRLCRLTPDRRERLLGETAEKLGFARDADPYDELPMLTPEQLREMVSAGIAIGSHTVTHPALSSLSREDARRELAESKKSLESMLARPVRLFAYPFGEREHFNAETMNLARDAGYTAACTTIQGINRAGTNPLALLRIGVQDDPPAVFAFKLSRFL